MLKGAIFDHDGLMFDTEVIWQKNWDKIADEMGIVLPDEFRKNICGTSGELMNSVVKKYYGVEDGKEIIARVKQGVFDDEAIHIDEKPGLREIIDMFKRNGVIMAVASSSPEEMLWKNLKNAGIDDYFAAVVSGQHVEHGKPAPDIFLLAAEKIGIDPKDCYVFEDAYNGVNAGHNAGCYTVMIPDMLQPNDEIRKVADEICESLSVASKAIEEGKF